MDKSSNSTASNVQQSVNESSNYVMYTNQELDEEFEYKIVTCQGDVQKTQEHTYTGHFTRGVKRSLQNSMTNVLKRAPTTSCSNSVSTESSLLPSLPHSSSFPQLSSSPPIHLLSSTFNTTASSYEAYRVAACSNVQRSHSIIAHILTGEDKNLGASVMLDNCCVEVLSDDDKPFVEPQTSLDAACSDVDGYLNDSLRASSSMGKFGCPTNDWDLDDPDCPRKDPVAGSDSNLLSGGLESGMSCGSTWNRCSTCLIVQNKTKAADLKQEILQALQLEDIKVVKLRNAGDVCSAESLNIVWIHVPQSGLEELSTMRSLIYANKENKSTYFIAITDTQLDVDLRLYGFDEVYVQPIPKETIQRKYQQFHFVTPSEAPSTAKMTTVRDRTSTPESTISIESVRTAEYSRSSTCDSVSSEMDINISDLKSTLSVPLCSKSPFLSDDAEKEDRSSLIDPQSPPIWCRVEHATKEKQRRERIKDSCDQLRVLLPYVKGRKTDMASILEMTVDYLKIVNAALPQDFQSHVIDIMSNGTSLLGRLGEIETVNIVSKKVNRRRVNEPESAPLARSQANSDKNSVQSTYGCSSDKAINKSLATRPLSCAAPYAPDKVISSEGTIMKSCTNNTTSCTNTTNGLVASKRECPTLTQSGSNKAKKPHISVVSSVARIHSPTVVYLPAGNVTPIKEAKKENISEVTNQGQQYPSSHFSHLLNEGDTSSGRVFSSNNLSGDIFSYQGHTPVNTPTGRISSCDRADLPPYGGMYFDGAFYHYYSPMQDTSSGNYFVPGGSNEYVNPNAVLPMTSFTPRTPAFNSSRKFDRPATEIERFNIGDQDSEMFSTNCITGLKPN